MKKTLILVVAAYVVSTLVLVWGILSGSDPVVHGAMLVFIVVCLILLRGNQELLNYTIEAPYDLMSSVTISSLFFIYGFRFTKKFGVGPLLFGVVITGIFFFLLLKNIVFRKKNLRRSKYLTRYANIFLLLLFFSISSNLVPVFFNELPEEGKVTAQNQFKYADQLIGQEERSDNLHGVADSNEEVLEEVILPIEQENQEAEEKVYANIPSLAVYFSEKEVVTFGELLPLLYEKYGDPKKEVIGYSFDNISKESVLYPSFNFAANLELIGAQIDPLREVECRHLYVLIGFFQGRDIDNVFEDIVLEYSEEAKMRGIYSEECVDRFVNVVGEMLP